MRRRANHSTPCDHASYCLCTYLHVCLCVYLKVRRRRLAEKKSIFIVYISQSKSLSCCPHFPRRFAVTLALSVTFGLRHCFGLFCLTASHRLPLPVCAASDTTPPLFYPPSIHFLPYFSLLTLSASFPILFSHSQFSFYFNLNLSSFLKLLWLYLLLRVICAASQHTVLPFSSTQATTGGSSRHLTFSPIPGKLHLTAAAAAQGSSHIKREKRKLKPRPKPLRGNLSSST